MPKRTSKPSLDPSVSAHKAVQALTGGERKKNPAAVALGRLGGKVGGKARAEALTAKRRSEIAAKAAAARWNRKD